MHNRNLIRLLLGAGMSLCLLITGVLAVPTGTLQFGNTNNDVKELQQALQSAGYLDSSMVTGYFGDSTENAVKKYQKDNGIPVTGIAGSLTLSSLFTSSTLLDESAIYTIGCSGSSVKKLQQALVSLGYMKQSNVTGYYGSLTRSAVTSFQEDNYITTSGVAAELTLTKINGLTGASNLLDTSVVYKVGSESSGVKLLQEKLSDLGYLAEKYISGYYGEITESAVKSFQSSNKINATGVAATQTLTALNSPDAVKYTPPAKKPASTDKKPATGTTAPSVAVKGTLRQGDSGSAVSSLQSNLKSLGYYTGSVTGSFGDTTRSAVMAFQKAYGLTVDGIVGSVTSSKITSALSSKKTTTTATQVSSSFTSPNMTTINAALESMTDAQKAEVKLMAQLIKKEAGGQSYQCQVAIGSVVMNRVKVTGASVRSVIYAHSGSSYQFSPAKYGLDDVSYSTTNYYAAIEAYMGAKPVANSYYFCTKGTSCWASRNKTLYATISSESFFLP